MVRVQPENVTQLLTSDELAAEVRQLIGRPAEWVTRVRFDPEGRWYEQVRMCDSYEIWLLSWLPGQSTGFHDHGPANGAFGVVWGELQERTVPRTGTTLTTRAVTHGVVRSFGQHYVHDVVNESSDTVAVSVHAYSPPLTNMTRYKLTAGGLIASATETEADW